MRKTYLGSLHSILLPICAILASGALACFGGAIHYVNPDSLHPTAPFTSWETAAQVIQDALDSAEAGDEVVVTNGVYSTGGRIGGSDGLGEPNGLSSRVVVEKPVTLRSVNGPAVTRIVGYQMPETSNGDNAIRCAYLADGARVIGFTLAGGATRDYGGGPGRENKGGGAWCETTNATLSNCILLGNSAYYGGGIYGGTLTHCRLMKNAASFAGGGAHGSLINNCVLTANTAQLGGGAYDSTLNHCTLVGNSAREVGGGIYYGICNNSIVYFNTAGTVDPNAYLATLNNSCTIPLPDSGIGNFSDDPQLASATYLSATSPCRHAGDPAYATGFDIDGEPWKNPPSVGCDEYSAGGGSGPIGLEIQTSTTTVANFTNSLVAFIEGPVESSRWDFGDGVIVSNRPVITHAWLKPGDYAVKLTAYNRSYPEGVSTTVTVQVLEGIHYVAADNPTPVAPYTSWETAANTIQDAVDAAILPGAQVWVTNGVYATGGGLGAGMSNRVAVVRPIQVRSINGPGVTIIVGEQVPGFRLGLGAARCVFLTNGATMEGFTLTNGATRPKPFNDFGFPFLQGGGSYAWRATLSNCIITGNAAAGGGGGVYGGTLYSCLLVSNSAGGGGGAASATCHNCTFSQNSARYGGGTISSTLNSCLLNRNTAEFWGGGAENCTLNDCTLEDNLSNRYGGGAAGSTLNRCSLMRNAAENGGGAGYSSVNNCTLVGNSASASGGGVWGGTLNNCTVVNNTAASGGGVGGSPSQACVLDHCIVYYNTATSSNENYDEFSSLNHSCATPLEGAGEGNIDTEPQFIELIEGNLRLQAGSPCINTGTEGYDPGEFDRDGRPRIVAGSIDIGAYEFQGESMGEFIPWLAQFGLPSDGTADSLDSDGDQSTNFQEFHAGTSPISASSVLRLHRPLITGTDVVLSWDSVLGRTYFVEWTAEVGAARKFKRLTAGVPARVGTTTFTHAGGAASGPAFYRVGVDSL